MPLALTAIVLWSTLALLSTRLGHVPPFLVVGLALSVGGLCGISRWRDWRVPWTTALLGCYGLFGYHFCLLLALRFAPALEANLVNYLWPVLIVLLSPVVLPGKRLRWGHVVGGLMGLLGTVVLVLGRGVVQLDTRHLFGYALAALAAVMWSTYSLLTRKVAPFPTGAVGGFCLLSGVLALLAHAVLEPPIALTASDWSLLLLLGLGPMGAAFYLWDAALKAGDPRAIGTLAYLTPLLSTALLATFGDGRFGWNAGVALGLILCGAWLGNRASVGLPLREPPAQADE